MGIDLSFFNKSNFLLYIFLIYGFSLFAQEKSNRSAYINDKLDKIDSLIKIKEYDKANKLIANTKNTFSFRQNNEEKLALEFRSAQILYDQGKDEVALKLYLIGFEKLKSKDDPQLYIKYANILAKIFANSQNFDKGIYYNKLALKEAKAVNDTNNSIKSLIRLGSFYYAKYDLDSAKYFFRKVTYYPITPKTEHRISNAYNNLGVIASNNDNYNLARAWAKKALKIKESQKDSLGMAVLTVNIGNLYHYQNSYNHAIKNYLEALSSIVRDSTNEALNMKKVIYENLSVSYDSINDYKNAYKNLISYDRINEVLVKEQIATNLNEVAGKYNLALEEQKTEVEKSKTFKAQVLFFGLAFLTLTLLIIALIFYKNYKLSQRSKLEQIQNNLQLKMINATIDAKEEERKTIAEILHDSVSALLSSVNLHLQASKAQLKNNVPSEINKAQEILGEASTKIRDLSHKLISSVLIKFGLAFAVHDLCEKYSNSKLEFISDDNGIKRYNQKFEIKIYNIIEELINNILKHSEAKNASITLIERNGDTLLIQIIDDGKGFDIKQARRKDGLGLNHIDARVKMMHGVFNINSKAGEGTSIFISVPIFKSKMPKQN